jgi:hypothetical protein
VPNKDSETRKWHRKTSIDVVTRIFKFNLISLWCSELSFGIYCGVKWLSSDVSEVRTASIIRVEWNVGRQSFYTVVYPRRQFWTSYSPPWELEISHNFTLFVKVQCLDFHGYICQRGCVTYPWKLNNAKKSHTIVEQGRTMQVSISQIWISTILKRLKLWD